MTEVATQTTNMPKAVPFFLPWIIWGLGACFYAYEFALQVSPSVMGPELMRDFAMSNAMFGLTASLYFWAYASMQIPVGIFLDRFGPRRLLTMATGICAIAALAFSMAHNFPVLAISRFAIGFGSAFAVVGVMALAARWFPPRRFALLLGMLITLGMLGAYCGDTLLAAYVNNVGWRNSLFNLGIAGIVLTILMWLIVRDGPEAQAASEEEQWPILEGLKRVVRKPQSWILAFYGSLMFAPTLAFGGLWGVPFVSELYSVDRDIAGHIVGMLWIGWIVGSPFFGWLSDHFARRKLPMILASTGGLIFSAILLYLDVSKSVMPFVLFGMGFFSGGFLPSFSIIKEINPKKANATALGFMNMFNSLGGVILQPVIGLVLDQVWNGKILNGSPIYSIGNYKTALMAMPICFAISILLLPFIKETYCKPSEEH